MKIFSIPEWGGDSNLKHYATTWLITSDFNGNNIVYRVDKSTESLLNFEINFEIPIGHTYYIKALRHLDRPDHNGTLGYDVEYNHWIGPIKLINENTETNEAFIPELYIDTPYIKYFDITAEGGLSVELIQEYGNVPRLYTRVIIESGDGTEVYSHDYDMDTYRINISNTIFNFTVEDKFYIKILYIGDLNVISPVLKEEHSYVQDQYRLIGNTSLIDPAVGNTLKFITTDSHIEVISAAVKTLEDNVLVEAVVDGDNITINQNTIKYDMSLKLVLTLEYLHPSSGATYTRVNEHFISTRNKYNLMDFNFNMEYLDEITLLNSGQPNNIKDIPLHTEQNTAGYIPILDEETKLKLYIHNESTNTFYEMDDVLGLGEDVVGVGGLPLYCNLVFGRSDRLYLVRENGDYTITTYYDYNNLRNVLYLSRYSITSPASKNNIIANSNVIVQGELYTFYNYDDDDDVMVILPAAVENDIYVTIPGLGNAEIINVTLIDTDTVLIIPVSDTAVYSYMYNFTYDTIVTGPIIPSEFRNATTTGRRLLNGDVIYTRYDSGNNKEYMVYNHITKEFDIRLFDIGTTKYFRQSIAYKSGAIDYITHEDDDTISIYRYQ